MTPSNRWAAKLLLVTMILILAACSPGSPPPAEKQTEASKPPETKEGQLPLPKFAPCASTAHPVLPAKWEATALMQDFFLNSLWFGKFVYDESVQAFRFSLADKYGIDYDFLVTTDRKLYLLEGGDLPTSCKLLTSASPFTVPAREWLNDKAVCVGQAPILTRDQQWWKNPSGAVGANWFWYDTGSKLPFRSMYYAKPTTPAPIYEHFTFNYFPTLKEVPSTNLGQLLQMCQRSAKAPLAAQDYSRPSIEPLMKKSAFPKTDARLIAKIQTWIPGVTECSSTGSLPPSWPDRTQLTAFMTAVNFQYNPFPTRVYYDWKKPAQNSTLYYDPPTAENYSQLALLLGDTGYIAMVRQNGSISSCSQALPGPQVPNWNKVDGCECRAQIAPHTVLNPGDVPTKILWCPTDLALRQVFWTWYTDEGRPVVFMQSNSSPTAGTGLNLADYYEWGPGSVAPAGTFDLPQACQGQPKQPNAFPTACNNCHLPLNARGAAAAKTP